jgi:Flp pilus assembly protein TadB
LVATLFQVRISTIARASQECRTMIATFQQAKRLIKIVFAVTLLAMGVAMLVLPGPGVVVIALALAILSGEFIWARRLLERMKETARRARNALSPHSPTRADVDLPGTPPERDTPR